MTYFRVAVVTLGAAGLLGCGSKPVPPELVTRETPSVGPQRTKDGTPIDLNNKPDASVEYYDAGACCLVNVAIAVDGDEDLAYAVAFPSKQRVRLSKSNGRWSGQLCFWLTEPVSYYYFQTGYALNDAQAADGGRADAGEFLFDTINRAAPTDGVAAVGEVNVFSPDMASTCAALDAGVHSQVFDAGVLDGG